MAECLVVGNFGSGSGLTLPEGCFISANNTINTELENYFCTTPLGGATIGTLNLSAYQTIAEISKVQQRASVTVPWLRKYDCENDKVHFIYVGEGRSSNANALGVTLNKKVPEVTTQLLSASSQSGPATLYTKIKQEEGFGMAYTKGPINFDTSQESSCKVANMGYGTGSYYLQTFYLEAAIGATPIVTYTFVYQA